MKGEMNMKSPVAVFCDEVAGMTWNELAGYCNLSNARYQLLVQGAYDRLPIILKKFADELTGPGSGEKLEADYLAFRDSLDAATRKDIESQLFPAGRAFGMCP
jgi:hypothetical protein